VATIPNAYAGIPSGAAGGVLSGTYPNPGLESPLELAAASAATILVGARITGDTTDRATLEAGGFGLGNGSDGQPVQITYGGGGQIDITASLNITSLGKGLLVAEGSNCKQGTATLAAGTVTVANTSITATSRIFLTTQAPAGTPGALYISATVAGTSFTVTSTSGADASTFAYEIFEVG
jgi:hypothetical protein